MSCSTEESKRAVCLNRVADRRLQFETEQLDRQRRASIQSSYAERQELQQELQKFVESQNGPSVMRERPGRSTPRAGNSTNTQKRRVQAGASGRRSPVKQGFKGEPLVTGNGTTKRSTASLPNLLAALSTTAVPQASAKRRGNNQRARRNSNDAFEGEGDTSQYQRKLWLVGTSDRTDDQTENVTPRTNEMFQAVSPRRVRIMSAPNAPSVQLKSSTTQSPVQSVYRDNIDAADLYDEATIEQGLAKMLHERKGRKSGVKVKSSLQLDREVREMLDSSLTPAVMNARAKLRVRIDIPATPISSGKKPPGPQKRTETGTQDLSRKQLAKLEDVKQRLGISQTQFTKALNKNPALVELLEEEEGVVELANSWERQDLPTLTAFVKLPHPSNERPGYRPMRQPLGNETVTRKAKSPRQRRRSVSLPRNSTIRDKPFNYESEQKPTSPEEPVVTSTTTNAAPAEVSTKTDTDSAKSSANTSDAKRRWNTVRTKLGLENNRQQGEAKLRQLVDHIIATRIAERKRNLKRSKAKADLSEEKLKRTMEECRYLRVYTPSFIGDNGQTHQTK